MRKHLASCLFWIVASAAIGALEPATPQLPERALCTVCARRGASHGEEAVAAYRQHGNDNYAFCSDDCAAAFDQMPEGYATPVLPRPAPATPLLGIDDVPVPLRVEGTRATLVDFWATWCAPCVRAMPELSQLYQAQAERGLRVLGVSIDSDRKALERFLRKQAPSYPVAHDDGEDAAWWAWKVPAVPALFLLDADGQIVAQWSGLITAAELASRVEELLDVD